MGASRLEGVGHYPVISHTESTIQYLEGVDACILDSTLEHMQAVSNVNKIYLFKKLFNLKTKEAYNIAEFLNDFNSLTTQLESAGVSRTRFNQKNSEFYCCLVC